MGSVATIRRIKNLILSPKKEWSVIENETRSAKNLILYYAAPLAGLATVAWIIKMSLFGVIVPSTGAIARTPLATTIYLGAGYLLVALVMVLLLSFIINSLAGLFGAQKNQAKALKVAAYSMTAAWLGGILQPLPWIGSTLAIFGIFFSIYLLYLGLKNVMQVAPTVRLTEYRYFGSVWFSKVFVDRAIGYTITVLCCGMALSSICSIALIKYTSTNMTVGSRDTDTSLSPPSASFEKGSPMAKLEQFGKSMEAANKKPAPPK